MFILQAPDTISARTLLEGLSAAGLEVSFEPVEGNKKPLLRLVQSSRLAPRQASRLASQPEGVSVTFPVRMGDFIDKAYLSLQGHLAFPQAIEVPEGVFDLNRGVFQRSGQPAIALTEKECGLIAALYAEGESSVSREALLKEVWEHTAELDTHTLETHIYRLRQKIEQDPAVPRIILTEREGYRLAKI